MSDLVARRSADLSSWQRAWALADGPVDVWIILLGQAGSILGGSRLGPPRWEWQGGRLTAQHDPVNVRVEQPGRVEVAWLAAVQGRQWAPVSPIDLVMHLRDVQAGDTVRITQTAICIDPGGVPDG